MGTRTGRAGVALLIAVAATVTAPLAAQACACGGFVGNDTVRVQQETAVVELGQGAEVVTMRFAADTAATTAAWVMPVPAKATVELGAPELFDQLDQLSAPEVREVEVESDDDSRAGGAQPPGTGVTVTERVAVGPYDVAQLAGNDPSAVASWLTANGFTLPPKLAGGLAPYLAEGWQLVAVRLTGASGGTLRGLLPPLKVAFPVDAPVYPMRLSGLAATPQALRLYVLADHRIDATSPAPAAGDLTVSFAGRNDQARFPAIPATASGPAFVTRFDGQWSTPGVISADVAFTRSATDEPHREVVTHTTTVKRRGAVPKPVDDADQDTLVFVLGGVVIVLAGAATVTGVALLRRRR